MKTSSVHASPPRGNGGTVRRQLLKKLKQSGDGGETLDRRQLLAALAELKRGSFDVRLPEAVGRDAVEAVGLYHMVLEGVVFTAGQLALLPGLEQPHARVGD